MSRRPVLKVFCLTFLFHLQQLILTCRYLKTIPPYIKVHNRFIYRTIPASPAATVTPEQYVVD